MLKPVRPVAQTVCLAALLRWIGIQNQVEAIDITGSIRFSQSSVDNDTPPSDADGGTDGIDGTVARDGTGDSDRVTDLMIAAGISQLQSMGWTLEDTKETLENGPRGHRDGHRHGHRHGHRQGLSG